MSSLYYMHLIIQLPALQDALYTPTNGSLMVVVIQFVFPLRMHPLGTLTLVTSPGSPHCHSTCSGGARRRERELAL